MTCALDLASVGGGGGCSLRFARRALRAIVNRLELCWLANQHNKLVRTQLSNAGKQVGRLEARGSEEQLAAMDAK